MATGGGLSLFSALEIGQGLGEHGISLPAVPSIPKFISCSVPSLADFLSWFLDSTTPGCHQFSLPGTLMFKRMWVGNRQKHLHHWEVVKRSKEFSVSTLGLRDCHVKVVKQKSTSELSQPRTSSYDPQWTLASASHRGQTASLDTSCPSCAYNPQHKIWKVYKERNS